MFRHLGGEIESRVWREKVVKREEVKILEAATTTCGYENLPDWDHDFSILVFNLNYNHSCCSYFLLLLLLSQTLAFSSGPCDDALTALKVQSLTLSRIEPLLNFFFLLLIY
jgi:hypothetical protein